MFRNQTLFQKTLHGIVTQGWAVRGVASVNQVSTADTEVKPFNAIPGPRGIYQWPIIGPVLTFKPFTKFNPETIHEYFNHVQENYGPVARIRLSSQVVLLSDPKYFEIVYRNEGKYPERGSFALMDAYWKRQNIRASLTQLHGAEWQTMRTAANKILLRPDSALHYLQQQNEVADDFVNILETQTIAPEDIQHVFFRYASESIGVVTFNKRLGLFEENPNKDSIEFLTAAETIMNMIARSVMGKSLLHKWFRNKTYRMYESSMNLARRIAIGHVTRARQTLENEIKTGTFDQDQPNFLFSLLSEKTMTDDYIASILISLYIGGTDSTAKIALVFLYNLAKYPEKQKILRKEIWDNLGRDGPLTAQALSKMVYLKAALKESFRLIFPLPTMTTRILPVDVVIGGYQVPAGVHITLCNNRALRSFFENPDQFLPERWLRSEENSKKDWSQSMIISPFGYGPRNCLGRQFALQETYLSAVKIIQRLEVSAQVESEKFVYKPFAESDKPIRFTFTKIS